MTGTGHSGEWLCLLCDVLPPPVGCPYVGILNGVLCRASHSLDIGNDAVLDCVQHIVAESDIVHNAFSQDFLICSFILT